MTMPKVLPIEDLPKKILWLVKRAQLARKKAYAPYSKFLVGCTLQDDLKKIHTGCNVENVSFSATVCAERVAVGKMVSRGARKIKNIVVITSSDEPVFPCGVCLQVLQEFGKAAQVYAVNRRATVFSTASLAELFPSAFDKQHLPSV